MPRRRKLLFPLLWSTCALLMASERLAAQETWTDDRLPVRAGIELWLDAQRVGAVNQALGRSEPRTGDPLDQWRDGSGKGRHVMQAMDGARPKLIEVGSSWVVRFDGEDDHLRHVGSKREFSAITVFLVAAPHDNLGSFRGFLAANQPQGRDYETGFTIDLGPMPGTRFDTINVEGRGFGGARDLMESAIPFGTLHVIEASVRPTERNVQCWVDGKLQAERPLAPAPPLRLDEITVGARYYTNGPGPQEVRGSLTGDIAEVLVYGRNLSDEETRLVRNYLEEKYASLREALPEQLPLAKIGEPLEPIPDPPPVQMLLPGFTVRQLPVDLTNINNVKYRRDGKLVALAYNGNIYLLSDTDGDGLEDKAELFWENTGQLRGPIGLALTPPGYPHGNGVFVPSKGKLSLIVDTDGDDRADREIVVASGWKEISQAVDAVGVTMDSSGDIYFALGTADYSNAYLIDQEGRSHYEIASERGTVQRVSPDFQRRQTVCTGVRFPVAMAFNHRGDLFCSEQEGATWLPNGNPFDELLHIQPGRHYGFPPRHPRHNPGVIDEPSVFDYGPQHQSTCGLNFNEPVHGGPIFGPNGWAHDALICGESRGKLFRTKLVKTPAGYVAQNNLLACLSMLTVDACVSPHGEFVVTCHSGPPDWGTGPSGPGKLFKISFTNREVAQPMAAWSAGPQTLHIAFDRPLDLEQLRDLAKHTEITYGRYVRAGDRFESLVPPYAVVQMQRRAPRFRLPVYSAQVTPDRRTLVLGTAPMREPSHYAVKLPGLGLRSPDIEPASLDQGNGLPQHPQIDIDYMLSGVQASLTPQGQGTIWSGWLPHLDLDVCRELTTGSAEHDRLWAFPGPGALSLSTQLDLIDMLRPAVQPGSHIDYEWAPEEVTVTFQSDSAFTVLPASGESQVSKAEGKLHRAQFTAHPDRNEFVRLQLKFAVRNQLPRLTVSYHTQEDPRERPFPLRRILLPWANRPGEGNLAAELTALRTIPELEGGSWSRGRRVFYSEEALCGKCHSLHAQGGKIGPDLSNLVHRDYASVVRDITEPSFAINPDYVGYLLALKDGRVLTGSIRTEGNQLQIGDEKGQLTSVSPHDVEEQRPITKSVMPEDLAKQLGPDRLRDVLTFLLTPPPRMPLESPIAPPPPRKRAEVQAVLAGSQPLPDKKRPIRMVLVDGPKDHGPGEHDYPAWKRAWSELLAVDEQVSVSTAHEWPNPEQWNEADAVVFFQRGIWNAQRAADIDAYLARGGGLVYLHWAVDGGEEAPEFAKRIGLTSNGKIRYRHGPLEIRFQTHRDHPIARNFDVLRFHDESYWQLIGDPDRITLLATSEEDGQAHPQFWTLEHGSGRVFVSILGHYSWTFDDPLFRVLLLRGMAWSAHEPIDRFNELVTLGARVED